MQQIQVHYTAHRYLSNRYSRTKHCHLLLQRARMEWNGNNEHRRHRRWTTLIFEGYLFKRRRSEEKMTKRREKLCFIVGHVCVCMCLEVYKSIIFQLYYIKKRERKRSSSKGILRIAAEEREEIVSRPSIVLFSLAGTQIRLRRYRSTFFSFFEKTGRFCLRVGRCCCCFFYFFDHGMVGMYVQFGILWQRYSGTGVFFGVSWVEFRHGFLLFYRRGHEQV